MCLRTYDTKECTCNLRIHNDINGEFNLIPRELFGKSKTNAHYYNYIMYHIVDFMNKLLICFVHSCHKAGSKSGLCILQRNTNMKSFNKDNSSLLFKT